jgi:hypothetical protein
LGVTFTQDDPFLQPKNRPPQLPVRLEAGEVNVEERGIYAASTSLLRARSLFLTRSTDRTSIRAQARAPASSPHPLSIGPVVAVNLCDG